MRLQTRGPFSKRGASVFGGLLLFGAFLFGGKVIVELNLECDEHALTKWWV